MTRRYDTHAQQQEDSCCRVVTVVKARCVDENPSVRQGAVYLKDIDET